MRTNPLIFVADDDEDDMLFVTEALLALDAQIQIQSFASGKEVIAALKTVTQLPNFVILDLNMPLVNGFDVLKEIRTSVCRDSLPILIHSTASDDSIKKKCYELGANDFVTKPFSFKLYQRLLEPFVLRWCSVQSATRHKR